MAGVPGESKETMEETIKFASDSELHRMRLYTCQPFPGSKLYEDCQKNGLLPDDFDVSKALIFESEAYIQTKDFSPEDLTLPSKRVTGGNKPSPTSYKYPLVTYHVFQLRIILIRSIFSLSRSMKNLPFSDSGLIM